MVAGRQRYVDKVIVEVGGGPVPDQTKKTTLHTPAKPPSQGGRIGQAKFKVVDLPCSHTLLTCTEQPPVALAACRCYVIVDTLPETG